jgi:sugar/nucleoside kinase (ribokinase family)
LLPCPPEAWVRQVLARYGVEIAVVGLGAEGALLAVRSDGFLERIPAVRTREVVNTIGAGDALFSAFVHAYHRTGDPYQAIQKALVFASYKIGATGAADGFLDQKGLDDLYAETISSVGGSHPVNPAC